MPRQMEQHPTRPQLSASMFSSSFDLRMDAVGGADGSFWISFAGPSSNFPMMDWSESLIVSTG
jgi:hypothetical protein